MKLPDRDVQQLAPSVLREAPLITDPNEAGPIIKGILAQYRRRADENEPLSICLELATNRGEGQVLEALAKLGPAWRDHVIAGIYSMKMPTERRKRLGAYFTPPHLVDHLVARMTGLGLDIAAARIRDPAAGGAAFLVPLARLKVALLRATDLSDAEIVARLSSDLIGREIEPDLAALANTLIRRMLTDEFGMTPDTVGNLSLIIAGDSLAPLPHGEVADHEIGNPPYLRLSRATLSEHQDACQDIATGRLNLYAMFIRRALDRVPPGGMIGYVVPASFLGGPEFTAFRRRVLQLAEVLVIDLIEKRRDVFLDAIQDACFLVLRRRATEVSVPETSGAMSGVLRSDGKFEDGGTVVLDGSGGPWRLPGTSASGSALLADWGYRGTIGYLVANRQPERLHECHSEGRYPLVWAKAISTDGRFDFVRGVAHKGAGWADAPADAPYIVRSGCVAVQRTSSRSQKRRLNAAAIPKSFIDSHGGVIAENHVILLVPTRLDAVAPELLAAELNKESTSAELDRVCGSASISVRLLEGLQLASPPSPI